ncbi:pentatricopeptide repeat-containing protein At4g21065 [Amborella trichopoda]|uniref:pentatricopeptide repeat-containing protein At4g21065 n=1 Tax=Amborella trichopoda TaxID=13333 RepID=UPI0005D383FE|nr:pentatricopeptide repeat-containing protein At4g21065 [Amborella trichopoda]|eukprot:XP_011628407.1 pentatricopeptide repeat-containing protein At4g21065 [Amborella trichopoda]
MKQAYQYIRQRCVHTLLQENTSQLYGSLTRGAHPTSCFGTNLILDELAKSGEIEEARKMFDGMDHRDEFSWNTMISGYAKLGRLDEAQRLFEAIPKRVSATWSSIISGYARYGLGHEAMEMFYRMQLDGLRPDQYTFGGVLRACAAGSVVTRGEQVHAYTIKTSLDMNVFVVTGLVDMYAKCKKIGCARYLFDNNPERNMVLWTAMLTGHTQNAECQKAAEIFCEMQMAGVKSNQFTFPSILSACAALRSKELGLQVHASVLQTGFSINVFVQSALIDMYSKCDDLASAQRVLDGMAVADEVSWNSLLGGYVKHQREEEALLLFKEMHIRSLRIDDFTFPSVLNACASLIDLKQGNCAHAMIVKTGFGTCKHVGNALVDMYAKCGSLECASRALEGLPGPDVVSWTSLLTGYTHHGLHEEALKLFCEMRIARVKPDEFVIASALSACAGLSVLELGQQFHAIFVRLGFGSSLSIDNSLVTMYAKCGCIEDAHLVFDLMLIRDVVSWTALIVGYAQNGRGKDALSLYEQMILNGDKPDYITFIGVFFACSHAGLLEAGRQHFKSMHKAHNIKPRAEHYACMIDMLGRAGKIQEAESLLNEMSVEPDATVWKALLSACRVHGNVRLAEKAAKSLFKLEPDNAVPYVMLSNIYSSAGKWDDSAKIRRLMKERGVTKEPGCSWIEVDNMVHAFLVEDRGHPKIAEIYAKVEEILGLIKKEGYVPDMTFALHDVDEEGKELGLASHSEKLALAFGLLSLPAEKPIRIVKNLRVCGDCHSAIKFASRVYARKIIVRDSNCFHHFHGGFCSCRDYW